ncbi:hydroxymethylglutaryl-CoA lyase, partial [bacterium]|nr:hydroxymethylglutaryl-CoA lyase [bacterium]
DISNSESKLFVLVPNVKGGEKAAKHNSISYIGYPFSTSETFLKKNINSDFDSAIDIMNRLQDLCLNSNKTLMLYLAMAFGNPYGDPSDVEIILEWVDKLNQMGVNVISLSDIIGIATPEQISKIYQMLSSEYPNIEFGIHLHIKDNDWYDKIDAAYKNGCKIFDGVISGIGGCPMTGYEMLGNLPTGNILDYAQKNNIPVSINENKFNRAKKLANEILSDLL